MQPKPKMVRVRATLRGYFDVRGNRHPLEFQPGDVFEVPEHMVSKRWMVRLEDQAAPAAAPAGDAGKPKKPAEDPAPKSPL